MKCLIPFINYNVCRTQRKACKYIVHFSTHTNYLSQSLPLSVFLSLSLFPFEILSNKIFYHSCTNIIVYTYIYMYMECLSLVTALYHFIHAYSKTFVFSLGVLYIYIYIYLDVFPFSLSPLVRPLLSLFSRHSTLNLLIIPCNVKILVLLLPRNLSLSLPVCHIYRYTCVCILYKYVYVCIFFFFATVSCSFTGATWLGGRRTRS